MKTSRTASIMSLVLFLGFATLLGLQLEQVTSPSPEESLATYETQTLARVIDGDTIETTNGERVRLIGIDAPERGEAGFDEAKEYLERLLDPGDDVILQPGKDTYDRYGRQLAYVYLGDVFINEAMIASGWALPLPIPPNTLHQETFASAHQRAQNERRGLFQSTE